LSLQHDRQNQRRRKSDRNAKDASDNGSGGSSRRAPPGNVGSALRTAYQRMVDEDIPPEMLDLLGKLG
jgi:hypothetical protein